MHEAREPVKLPRCVCQSPERGKTNDEEENDGAHVNPAARRAAASDVCRQDDPLILLSLELAAQPLGRFPDIAREVVELGLVQR